MTRGKIISLLVGWGLLMSFVAVYGGCTSNQSSRQASTNPNYAQQYKEPQRQSRVTSGGTGQEQQQTIAQLQPVTIVQMATLEGKIVPGQEYIVYADIANPSNRDLTFRWEIKGGVLLPPPEEKKAEVLNMLRSGELAPPEPNQAVPSEEMLEGAEKAKPAAETASPAPRTEGKREVSAPAEGTSVQEQKRAEFAKTEVSEVEKAAKQREAVKEEPQQKEQAPQAPPARAVTKEKPGQTSSLINLIRPRTQLLAKQDEESKPESGEEETLPAEEVKEPGALEAEPVEEEPAPEAKAEEAPKAKQQPAAKAEEKAETETPVVKPGKIDASIKPELEATSPSQEQGEAPLVKPEQMGKTRLLTKDPVVSFVPDRVGKVVITLTVLNLKGEELTDPRQLIIEATEPDPAVVLDFNQNQVMTEGSYIYLDLKGEHIKDFRRGLFNIQFDNERLAFKGAAVGDFFPDESKVQFFYAQPNKELGVVTLGLSWNDPAKTLSGSGILATLRFKVLRSIDDPSTLSFTADRDPVKFYVLDSTGENILPDPNKTYPPFANNRIVPAGGVAAPARQAQPPAAGGNITMPSEPQPPAPGEKGKTEVKKPPVTPPKAEAKPPAATQTKPGAEKAGEGGMPTAPPPPDASVSSRRTQLGGETPPPPSSTPSVSAGAKDSGSGGGEMPTWRGKPIDQYTPDELRSVIQSWEDFNDYASMWSGRSVPEDIAQVLEELSQKFPPPGAPRAGE